jgi:hypothetical protein
MKGISSDKEFYIVSSEPDQVRLRPHLSEHESARIRIAAVLDKMRL